MCARNKYRNRITALLFILTLCLNSNAGALIIVDNIKYGVYRDSIAICNGIADKNNVCPDIIIPDSIDVNGVKLPVRYISGEAFGGINNVRTIRLPETLEHITMFGFSDCDNLSSINIPSSLKEIPENAFFGSNLESITVSPQNQYYDSNEGVNAIIDLETNLLVAGSAKTVIPGTVSALGQKAFSGRRNLKQISIPSSVSIIHDDCFKGCDSLLAVCFLNDDIGNQESKLNIATGAFMDCQCLESVDLPDRLDTLGAAFAGCSQLAGIYIPQNVTFIAGGQFYKCAKMQSVVVDSNNKRYDSRDCCNAIIETKDNRLSSACPTTIIPDGVKSIGKFSYADVAIDSIFIPNSVRDIEEYAFQQSTVRSVVIPERIDRIDLSSFGYCDNLQNIYLMRKSPPKLTELGDVIDADYLSDALLQAEYECLKNVKVYVPSKSLKRYRRNRLWRLFDVVQINE